MSDDEKTEEQRSFEERLDALHDDWVQQIRRWDLQGEYGQLRRAHGDELRHQLARCRSLLNYAYANATKAEVRL